MFGQICFHSLKLITSRLTNLRSRLTVLNQLQFDFIQHWNYTPSIHRYRTQSLCSNRTLKCPPVKITFRKRSNSSSSLLSSSHSTEINTDHPISLTYFLRKNNLLSNRSSSFLKDKKMIRNDDALITDIIPNFKHSRNSIQSSSSESTSSTLCYSQNEENNSNFKEISTQIIKETLPGVIDSKNSSLDKIMTSLSILNPLHSPLIIYLNRMLKYFNTESDKNDLTTIEQNELTLIEHNLTNIWKYFNELILNMKMNSKQFNLDDDFMKLVDNNMVTIYLENTSSNLFDQLIILTNEIYLSIRDLNKYLSKLSSSEHQPFPLPNLWYTLFKTTDLLCIEMMYSLNTPVLTMKELENRYNKNLALFSQIYSYCYRLHLLNESNNTTEDNQPLQYEECKSHIQQQQQITDLINRGLDLNQKLMIWSANCHSLLDRWKRLSIQVDWFNDNMINKKGMNNKDDCYNCVNSYLLQRFNLLEQNIIHSMKSLFVTTHEHSFKFKLDDIIKQCIHVNSWYNEYIQLEPLFIYVSTHIFTIKSFHQTICSRINNADILPNTILTSDWLILGIRLHQLKSVLHIIMNRWIHIVSLCNNVNALLDNAELSNVMSQIYPQKSGCSHIHRSLRSFNYQEAIDELKKQQILLNSLFLNEDTNCSHDVVNDLVGTFKNSSSPSSIVADEVNDGIIHNCHITNEIFLSSKSQVLCTICHRNPLIDNNIIDVSSINMLINEQVEHLKALNQYKVDDEKNTINFEQNQIYLTTLQRRIDMISEWIIHFIDETVLASSFNDELQENAEIFLDQLVKIEELLQNCLNEYETIIVYHVNDINIKIQLDLSILLINCLQVYINQLTQRIKHECEEILTYIKTNVKCLIEKMKMMLLVDVDDIMFIQYPYHEINQRCTSLNSLKSVYSTKSTNIQEIQFKLLYMTCIHNHLVNLCKVVNWASINAHSDTTVLLRQFCCSYTYLNRINKYIEYYNNTHQDESTDSIKLGSSLTLSALDPLQEGMRQKNCIKACDFDYLSIE
ncbi:putative normocyte-binding protein 1 [Schistosoma mansoni]|uniref:putative normocyte-binding protein 1 n=1 Tax=Schistosoma mansoni TaxID=6183 RepID=UPI00022DC17B|nr:putative normocyte-binding protein 1 [Schistosoma mansoni]|eukprot:XP_018650523.1 putative normocyte-binding protein 1 [Schistosoma mansoni]